MKLEDFRQEVTAIPDDPFTRVADHIKPLIQRDDVLINCHCHVFNQKTVPKALFNMKMPYNKRLAARIVKFLHRLNKRSNDDWGSRQAYFIDLFSKETREIAGKLVSYYPPGTIFTPLMMDMHNRAGSEKRKPAEYYIREQAKDLKALIDNGYNFLPFLPVDPTFEDLTRGELDVFDVFVRGFTGRYGIMPFGIKVYPTLGYLPGHPKLMEIYRVCQEKNIPVTAHCSRGVKKKKKKRIRNIEGWKIGPDGQLTDKTENRWFLTGNSYAKYFNHPKNWEKILDSFPNLRLNLGHFGGARQWEMLREGRNNTWVSRIFNYFMRPEFKNVFADLSFTNAHPDLFPLIRDRIERTRIVRERTLYGIDYYMVVVKGHYRSLKADFDVAMGDDIIRKIGIENPRAFLFGSRE